MKEGKRATAAIECLNSISVGVESEGEMWSGISDRAAHNVQPPQKDTQKDTTQMHSGECHSDDIILFKSIAHSTALYQNSCATVPISSHSRTAGSTV